MKFLGWSFVILLIAGSVFFGFVLYEVNNESKAATETQSPVQIPKPNQAATADPEASQVSEAPETPQASDTSSQILATDSEDALENDSEIEFAGRILFTADFDDPVTEYEGNPVLKEVKRTETGTITYALGAANADIKVKNSSGKIVGLFNTDSEGEFSFSVPKDDFYQLELLFLNDIRMLDVKAKDVKNIYSNYGYYSVYFGKFTTIGEFSTKNPL